MRFEVLISEQFEEDYKKLDKSVKLQIVKLLKRLEENPFVGKELAYDFFREKKIGKFRVYYLIYEEYVIVFVIAISDKKTQQKAIDKIKDLIPVYKEKIEERFKQK